MALRIKWLVNEKCVDPNDITVMTFTAEAALNMRHRLSDEEKQDVYLPRDKQPSRISTMHSLGLRIITNNLEQVGLQEQFKVLESDYLRRIIFGDAAQLVGLPRSKGIEVMQHKSFGFSFKKGSEEDKVARLYNSILRISNAIDYDDQILLAIQLLLSSPALLKEYQSHAKHLLIDEYQDINEAQFQLIKLLAGDKAEGLFAVGDDDQSIYSFRGGSPEFIRRFSKDFTSSARVLEIPKCRRCPGPVLHSALAIVRSFNSGRLEKAAPEVASTITTPIQIISSPTAEAEADFIANKCSRLTPSHDVLILLPQMTFAKPILTALRRRRVAYDCRSIVTEDGFISLDTIGHWLSNPADNFALRNTLQILLDSPMFGVPGPRSRKPEKKAERETRLAEFANIWSNVLKNKSSLFESLELSAKKSEFVSSILDCLNQLLVEYPKSAGDLLDVLRKYTFPWDKSEQLFQEIAMWIDEVKGRSASGQSMVRVMSMRLAKGLETDYVFVVGLENDVFPKMDITSEELQESSRLLFVSMTRAKVELNLCTSRTRSASSTHLQNSFALKPSSFLSVLPKEHTKNIYLQAPSKVAKNEK